MEDEWVTRSGQCAGCAFAPGSPANESLSMIKAKLCLYTGEPFWCHWNVIGGGDPPQILPGTKRTLCRGWVDAMEHRIGQGIKTPEWQQELYLVMNEAISEIESRRDLDKDPDGQIALLSRRVLEFLRATPSAAPAERQGQRAPDASRE